MNGVKSELSGNGSSSFSGLWETKSVSSSAVLDAEAGGWTGIEKGKNDVKSVDSA